MHYLISLLFLSSYLNMHYLISLLFLNYYLNMHYLISLLFLNNYLNMHFFNSFYLFFIHSSVSQGGSALDTSFRLISAMRY